MPEPAVSKRRTRVMRSQPGAATRLPASAALGPSAAPRAPGRIGSYSAATFAESDRLAAPGGHHKQRRTEPCVAAIDAASVSSWYWRRPQASLRLLPRRSRRRKRATADLRGGCGSARASSLAAIATPSRVQPHLRTVCRRTGAKASGRTSSATRSAVLRARSALRFFFFQWLRSACGASPVVDRLSRASDNRFFSCGLRCRRAIANT